MDNELPKELIFDLVLIKPDAPVQKDFSADEKVADTGEVIMVGKGKQAENTGEWILMQVEVGSRYWFDRHGATQYMDTEYVIMEQGYIKSKI